MSSTTFASGTVISSTWLNDVNTVAYNYFGDGSSLKGLLSLPVVSTIAPFGSSASVCGAVGATTLYLGANGQQDWAIAPLKQFTPANDNLYDLGISLTNRLRSGYFGSQVNVTGDILASGADKRQIQILSSGGNGSFIGFGATAQGADGKYWDTGVLNNIWQVRVINDANNASTQAITVTRSGMTITDVSVKANLTVPSIALGTGGLTTLGSSLGLGTGGQLWWTLDASTAHLYPVADNVRNIGQPGNRLQAVFTPIIDSGSTGSTFLKTNNGETGFRVDRTAASVNFLAAVPNVTTGGPLLLATGTDAAVPMNLSVKGAGQFNFNTNAEVSSEVQFQVLRTASSTRNITVTGSNGGNPVISTTAGDLGVAVKLRFTPSTASIIGGATSLQIRNNADSADNLFLTDSGLATFRNTITLSAGRINIDTAASQLRPGATSMSFRNNADNADNLLIADAGSATFRGSVGVGGATPAGGGSGIQFPATQSASSDANNLDDYEEGTWTPSVGGNATYTSQIGRYTKIGRQVYIEMDLIINVLGTGSTVQISGLPFNIGFNAGQEFQCFWSNSATAIVYMTAAGNGAGTSSLSLFTATAATASLSNANNVFQNNARVILTGSYMV